MSSIAGLVAQTRDTIEDAGPEIARVIERMRHRGPDNTIVRTLPDGRGALGANEINLAPTRHTSAAMVHDPPYVLFTGALCNSGPGGQSDVAFVRETYLKQSGKGFSGLDGSFTCAVVEQDGEVILARDHVGAVPVFYGWDGETFCFSTEMKGLTDRVRFDIVELPPGNLYSSKSRKLQEFAPFSPEIPELPDNIPDTAKILRELLIEAVKRRMEGAGAVALSGGLDSSIIAVIAKEFNPDLKLFTGSVQSAEGPDLKNARLMAEFLGLEHFIYEITDADIAGFITNSIWYLESFDEDCISGILSNYYVSRLVKEHCDSVLVGEGADELFGGYRMVLKSPRVESAEHREQLAKKLLEISYNTALRRLDRAWMANAVDYRTPFLDKKVVDFSQKIPMEWKIHGDQQVEKYILREAFRDLLPEPIANREKLRFAMGTGMDDVMDALVAKVVAPEELEKRPKAYYGLPFATFKELYYYDEFLKLFPPAYENQTIRWDPFK